MEYSFAEDDNPPLHNPLTAKARSPLKISGLCFFCDHADELTPRKQADYRCSALPT